MADFLGFWMVENRATVSRAASLYPELRQKKSRPKAARQLKSSLSSRSYPAEPGISGRSVPTLGLTPPSRFPVTGLPRVTLLPLRRALGLDQPIGFSQLHPKLGADAANNRRRGRGFSCSLALRHLVVALARASVDRHVDRGF